MAFRLTFDTSGSAFDDNSGAEAARILRKLADRIDGLDQGEGKVLDINGNSVGTWEFDAS